MGVKRGRGITMQDEIAIERLDSAENEYWSQHSLGGTVYFNEKEEREIYLELFCGVHE